MEKRTHKNYDIIQTIAFPDEEYVLGIKAINDKMNTLLGVALTKKIIITDTILVIIKRLLKIYMNVHNNI